MDSNSLVSHPSDDAAGSDVARWVHGQRAEAPSSCCCASQGLHSPSSHACQGWRSSNSVHIPGLSLSAFPEVCHATSAYMLPSRALKMTTPCCREAEKCSFYSKSQESSQKLWVLILRKKEKWRLQQNRHPFNLYFKLLLPDGCNLKTKILKLG